MRQLRIATRRLRQLVSFIRGESIVLTIKGNKLEVDAGTISKTQLKEAASVFFEGAVTL